MAELTPRQRSYAGELEWAIGQASSRNHDRNPNRFAQVNVALNYGNEVGIARRSHDKIPE